MPLIMGILNVTPDSFYSESRSQGVDAAVRRALEMGRAGADIIDIGGQSTRPGSDSVSEAEELRRVLPVVEALAAQVPTLATQCFFQEKSTEQQHAQSR